MHCDGLDTARFREIHDGELGVANANRILEHGRKHRLKITRGPADELEHVRRCRLLLQRFGEVGGALSQFVEQPRILDGYDGSGGEVRDRAICLSVKRRTSWRDQKAADQSFHPRAAMARPERPYARTSATDRDSRIGIVLSYVNLCCRRNVADMKLILAATMWPIGRLRR